MPKTKVEVYDKDQLIYPFIESEHVTFSNGMKITEMLDHSISMPTITHNETSFKVGVGDSDVSSSIVDSSVSKMVIKGQTYQNILPEPSLRNKMIGKSMQRLNEGYDNIEVVDGVSKSAILSGNTLVNLIKKLTPENYGDNKEWKVQGSSSPTHTCNSDGSVTATSTIKGSMVLDYYNLTLFKPNTEYTLFVSVDWNGVGIAPRLSKISTNDISLNNGLNIVKFTTVSDLTVQHMCFRLGYAGTLVSGCEYTFNNIMALEGDYTNIDIPYFTGMQSVKMPVLQTVGKNLFDKTSLIFGGHNYSADSSYSPNTTNNTRALLSKGSLIDVEPQSTVTLSCDSNFKCVIQEYDANENKTMSSDKGWQAKGYHTLTVGKNTKKINIYFTKQDPNSSQAITYEELDILKNSIQVEVSSSTTTYEPYKTNILHTPEDVVLRGFGDVKDTLNCLTGELTQRIEEVVLDGSERWVYEPTYTNDNVYGCYIGFEQLPQKPKPGNFNFANNMFPNITNNSYSQEGFATNPAVLSLRINKNKLDSNDVSGFKKYLQNHPVTLQYPLATESIKTVDLSSSGNWEKVVLNGSEYWGADGNYCFCRNLQINSACAFTDSIPVLPTKTNSLPSHASFSGARYFTVLIDGILNDPVKLKQYLRQNPITVWYQTTTHQDSTQVKQPIFFKDGHVQLSSGTDNSLIPTLDYQAKTSNSYVMDLMKSNTKYTMKAKSASGTFTIDGTSYGAVTNGTFITPTSMTNKLLVMNNKTNKEVMILEGDVTSKTIPYFKGIKSAFEGEDKIEVLSTGKNLFDGAFEKGIIDVNGNLGYTPTAIRTVNYISVKPNASYHINLLNLEPFESARVVYVHEYDENFKVLGETQVDNRNIYTSKSATKFIKINTHTVHDLPVDSKMIVCENSTLDKQYEPHKSNNTKIPLLSPLRSLPNGVYDEIILNRENNNVKMIRRVGRVVLNGEEGWTHEGEWHRWYSSCMNMARANDYATMILNNSENLPVTKNNTFLRDDTYGISGYELTSNYPNQNWIYIRPKNVSNTQALQSLLSQNPTTVLYELATPIITEIDLEGYPYIYKDGHIFLNSDIAPTTQITYSINQSQQIESANENLQRHEKEISHLQKLIAQYIQVEYESTLLSLKL